jgi:hypothetical protein
MFELGDVVAAGEDPDQPLVHLNRFSDGGAQILIEGAIAYLDVELLEFIECENQTLVFPLQRCIS